MQEELNQIANLALFAKIVQTGGISRCASDLGMERTTVSRRLGDLERTLGVRLLDRTPRKLSVTEAGRLCFERCEQLLEVARNAQTVATNGETVVGSEPIVVGAPPDIIERYLSPKLADFETANPKISVLCIPTSAGKEAASSNVDLTIAWDGHMDSRTLVRRLTVVEQSIFASPGYVAKHGTPDSPQDLKNYSCIVDQPVRRRLIWKFESGLDGVGILIRHTMEVSGLLEARASAVAGLGLCRLPDYLCERNVKEGRLVRLLSEYTTTARPLFLISARHRVGKPRVTTLRLFLENAFAADSL